MKDILIYSLLIILLNIIDIIGFYRIWIMTNHINNIYIQLVISYVMLVITVLILIIILNNLEKM